jgi:hypothetical protein
VVGGAVVGATVVVVGGAVVGATVVVVGGAVVSTTATLPPSPHAATANATITASARTESRGDRVMTPAWHVVVGACRVGARCRRAPSGSEARPQLDHTDLNLAGVSTDGTGVQEHRAVGDVVVRGLAAALWLLSSVIALTTSGAFELRRRRAEMSAARAARLTKPRQ